MGMHRSTTPTDSCSAPTSPASRNISPSNSPELPINANIGNGTNQVFSPTYSSYSNQQANILQHQLEQFRMTNDSENSAYMVRGSKARKQYDSTVTDLVFFSRCHVALTLRLRCRKADKVRTLFIWNRRWTSTQIPSYRNQIQATNCLQVLIKSQVIMSHSPTRASTSLRASRHRWILPRAPPTCTTAVAATTAIISMIRATWIWATCTATTVSISSSSNSSYRTQVIAPLHKHLPAYPTSFSQVRRNISFSCFFSPSL